MGIINLNIIKAYQTKRFLLFFSAAAFVWMLNNLSDTFEKEISFKLQYVNPNKDLFISDKNPNEVSLKIKASGYKLMSLSLSKPILVLNILGVSYDKNKGYSLSENNQLSQFQSQLGVSVTVTGFKVNAPVVLSLFKLSEKKVVVRLVSETKTKSNFFVVSQTLSQDSVVVRGSSAFLKSINEVETVLLKLSLLDRSIDTVVFLNWQKFDQKGFVLPEKLSLKIEMSEFSEIVIQSSIKVLNLPDQMKINFFPNSLPVIVAAPLAVLKNISPQDIELHINYLDLIKVDKSVYLPSIKSLNKGVFRVKLQNKLGVEYILTSIK
ncbi:MAG: hypothetical protein ACI8YW_000646 [Flavobacteriaceae bacterium]|jgi:hypothetical protein